MFSSWGTYYKPIHLNNTTGHGVVGGDLAYPDTTPIVSLAEADGSGYTPLSTQFIDVYSGGAPFTLTQELVQRGAEVQEDNINIAIVGSTMNACVEVAAKLRRALSMQEYAGFQILKIKRKGQTQYSEWFVQSAIIQEAPTYLGRDSLFTGYPTLYLNVKITRSPYASGSSTSQFDYHSPFVPRHKWGIIDIDTYPELIGSMVNFDLNLAYPHGDGTTFGPVAVSFPVDDTITESTISESGTLAAGGTASFSGTYSYQITDTTNIRSPLSILLVGDVQSNEVEVRVNIQGYSTPYVRAVGTQVNSSNGTARVFQLPPINIANIFSGFPDYNTVFRIPLTFTLRNLNRGSTRTYSFTKMWMFRSDNNIQLFPATDWTSKTTGNFAYRVASYYDSVDNPAQPLPSMKAGVFQMQTFALDRGSYTYSEAAEIRGTTIRVKNMNGNFNGFLVIMKADCSFVPMSNISGATWTFTTRFSALYQSIRE